jgi:hypothetical protein
MRTISLALPQFGFVVATRAMLGAGIALLLSDTMPRAQKRTIGTALVAIGAVSTIPAALWVSRSIRQARGARVGHEPRLVGATRYPRRGDEPDPSTTIL